MYFTYMYNSRAFKQVFNCGVWILGRLEFLQNELEKRQAKNLIEEASLIIHNSVSKRSHCSKVNCVHHLPSTFVNTTVVHNYLWL